MGAGWGLMTFSTRCTLMCLLELKQAQTGLFWHTLHGIPWKDGKSFSQACAWWSQGTPCSSDLAGQLELRQV